jgi:geranylgeranyl diphosphate synthase type I
MLYALEHANEPEKEILKYIYQQTTPVSAEQAEAVLAVMQRTQTKTYCRAFLEQQCQLAYKTLESIPGKTGLLCARALNDMKTLVRFVEATVR